MTDYTLAQWGAQEPKYALSPWQSGQPTSATIHYEGSEVPIDETIDYYISLVRAIQNYHMWHAKDNYATIAYNFVFDPLGNRYEGIGWDYQSQAQAGCGNPYSLALCYLGGPETPLTEAVRRTIKRTIDEAHQNVVVPHNSWPCVSTFCCGDIIRGWIDAGMPLVQDPRADVPEEEIMDVCQYGDSWIEFVVGDDRVLRSTSYNMDMTVIPGGYMHGILANCRAGADVKVKVVPQYGVINLWTYNDKGEHVGIRYIIGKDWHDSNGILLPAVP